MAGIERFWMVYSVDRAELLADQLERFAHSNVHQLAGQVANLDFWLDEAAHALRTIDEYPQRFSRLREAQVGWVKAHGTKVSGYCPICGGRCELGPQTPPAPTRIPSEQMEAARGRVRASAYRFLLRCYRSGLLDEAIVRASCERIGVVAETEDLERA
ncbi:hypothetical protein [Sorangium sp. So ce1389]|uniref:hypothetical protein n=1 Tax=Sorangium sp. So ce1389 TaxID=3133336 RepID=UPI003F624F9E